VALVIPLTDNVVLVLFPGTDVHVLPAFVEYSHPVTDPVFPPRFMVASLGVVQRTFTFEGEVAPSMERVPPTVTGLTLTATAFEVKDGVHVPPITTS
jgi:hypothetical protein